MQSLIGPVHNKARKRLYHKIATYKKALENPEKVGISQNALNEKKKIDREKRIQKKIKNAQEQKKLLNKVCLICKKKGHMAQNCPDSNFVAESGIDLNTTICYNCGRTDHTLKNCRKRRKESLPFAVCYVCKKTGHISRDCPDNKKGLYAKGGSCFICQSVRHKASECPNNPVNQKREGKFKKPEIVNNNNEESDEEMNKNAVGELEPKIEGDF